MAKAEAELHGDFDVVLQALDDAVLSGSMSASLEDASDWHAGDCRCAVRVYERYSYFGGNRVSLNLTLLESGGRLFVTAITAGGSQAVFFKINTLGETSFLDTVRGAIDAFR
ncbi:MAG: DUF6054 family protein [Oscillospiraceae bacterium]|nr:DUF6054 family protein [Oscillospiraceae bacterium]